MDGALLAKRYPRRLALAIALILLAFSTWSARLPDRPTPLTGLGPEPAAAEQPTARADRAGTANEAVVGELTRVAFLPGIYLRANGSGVVSPPVESCQLNALEEELAQLLINDSLQQRVNPRCDPILARVARERALDMATNNYFNHVNLAGFGPNSLVEQAGYSLPDFYEHTATANNIESIAAGYGMPGLAWQALVASPDHRPHVLGEDPFFAEQTDYGIGYAYDPDSDYGYYWVILTARH